MKLIGVLKYHIGMCILLVQNCSNNAVGLKCFSANLVSCIQSISMCRACLIYTSTRKILFFNPSPTSRKYILSMLIILPQKDLLGHSVQVPNMNWSNYSISQNKNMTSQCLTNFLTVSMKKYHEMRHEFSHFQNSCPTINKYSYIKILAKYKMYPAKSSQDL